MTQDTLNFLIVIWLAGFFCIGPCLLVACYMIGDRWRAWRWKRGAPDRAAVQAEHDRRQRAQVDQWNADARANGSDERILLAGLDGIVITYRGKKTP